MSDSIRVRASADSRRRTGFTLLLMLALGLAGSSQADPPPSAPVPPSRPLPAHDGPAPGGVASGSPAREQPAVETSPSASALPPTLPAPPPRPVDRPAPASAGGDVEACHARLRTLGVRFDVLPAIEEGECGTPFPVRVSGFAGGLDLEGPATTTCPVAETLARWVQESVVPEAGRLLGRAPRRLRIGGAYECRGRNRAAGAKLSEHAFANAVDLMGVEFAQGPAYTVAFQKAGSPEEAFQEAIRASACGRFATVLGPGSDETHKDHIHLDLRARRGGAMCQ